jgi:UDP-N-acetylglucosamine 2-epimerase
VGARPQFIKAAPVSKVLRSSSYREFLVHTGQHYDYGMSRIFFEEMGIPDPDVNLGVGSGAHGEQTGNMIIGIEKVLLTEKPDLALVYGDTNSTLAGALAAVKLHIPLAHVEAGLRSFNREMPEEHNRVLIDHCADLLFCPTKTAVHNLSAEGIRRGIHLVGDTMYDAVLHFSDIAKHRSTILDCLKLEPKEYLLATIHRPSNTDSPKRLQEILRALVHIQTPVIFPIHPRTRKRIAEIETGIDSDIKKSLLRIIDAVGYLDMLVLEQNARLILTDSGGIQKEAFFFKVPCVTLRTETEWVETVESGWNVLAGSEYSSILEKVNIMQTRRGKNNLFFGSGDASSKILEVIQRQFN